MTIEITFDGNKKINANLGGQIIKTDQPVRAGGEGSAPSPFDLFLASIGTCAGIYVKSFCDQRGIPTDNIRIFQHLSFNEQTRLFDKIDIEIDIPEDFPQSHVEALIRTAELCAVKKHLMSPPAFKVYTKTV